MFQVEPQQQCDLRNARRRRKRVIGGVPSRIGKWPWLVSFQVGDGEGGFQHSCGGTLISRDVVMTAAHCVYT